ncbi:MAG: ABC transporter permease [Bacteroidales bacterium]|jgi:peptide/nickel transport system permease protein|nr:ABC transporter permease [Bacteroidales bacterium]
MNRRGAIQTLVRNKAALVSIIFISLSAVVALLGYIIVPDSAPYANTQHIELSTLSPGTDVNFLLVKKNSEYKEHSFFYNMLFGEKNIYISVPVDTISFSGDNVVVTEYAGSDNIKGLEHSYHIIDVCYSVKQGELPDLVNGYYSFVDISGEHHKISYSDVKQALLNNNIVEESFLLGTDRYGRDMLSRLLIGTRVSLSVGFISVAISLIFGIFLGAIAGYYRGRVDNAIMWLVNVVWSVPTLLMVIAITMILGKGFWQVFIAIGLTMWVEVARVVRGQVLSIREKEYIEAARALALSNYRIITRHILPNALNPVIIISAANFASAILIEAGLSFLGIGVQPPVPSWGNMIKEHYGYIIMDKAYLAIAPGVAIMLMVLAFTLLGNGLRDALDTRSEAN